MMTSVTIHYVARLRSVRDDKQNSRWYFDFVYEGGSFSLALPYRTKEGEALAMPNSLKRIFSFDVDAEPAQMPITVGDKHFNITVFRPVKDAIPLGLQLVKE